MRFYNQSHRFYCGVDLHARTLYLCILSQAVPTSSLGLDARASPALKRESDSEVRRSVAAAP